MSAFTESSGFSSEGLCSSTCAATSVLEATSMAAVLRFPLTADSENISAISFGLFRSGIGEPPFEIQGDCSTARLSFSAAGFKLVDCS